MVGPLGELDFHPFPQGGMKDELPWKRLCGRLRHTLRRLNQMSRHCRSKVELIHFWVPHMKSTASEPGLIPIQLAFRKSLSLKMNRVNCPVREWSLWSHYRLPRVGVGWSDTNIFIARNDNSLKLTSKFLAYCNTVYINMLSSESYLSI